MPATRATTAAGLPAATSSRDRATRCLTPSPREFPRDLDLHRLAAQRPLQATDLAAQLVDLGALRLPCSRSAPAAKPMRRGPCGARPEDRLAAGRVELARHGHPIQRVLMPGRSLGVTRTGWPPCSRN
jgi:hypothetical protein